VEKALQIVEAVKGIIYAVAVIIGLLVIWQAVQAGKSYLQNRARVESGVLEKQSLQRISKAVKKERGKLSGMTGKQLENYINGLLKGDK
jgi:hypothetical protein